MSKTSALLDLVAAQREQMKVVLALLIASGLMLALAIPFVEPGDKAFPILVIDVVLVAVGFVTFSALYWYTTKREMDD
ncbi:hypothetical protein [Halosolutus gelatinilyticus]|uniref:hypothetical protein n=1 Tax=Halosolutus gelatinilyticus TaxID=2931975 RepID=UPI001FF4EDCC|nr:hypothetical protein [Halosolutus gelatinilyticus]